MQLHETALKSDHENLPGWVQLAVLDLFGVSENRRVVLLLLSLFEGVGSNALSSSQVPHPHQTVHIHSEDSHRVYRVKATDQLRMLRRQTISVLGDLFTGKRLKVLVLKDVVVNRF